MCHGQSTPPRTRWEEACLAPDRFGSKRFPTIRIAPHATVAHRDIGIADSKIRSSGQTPTPTIIDSPTSPTA